MEVDIIYNEDCLKGMKRLSNDSVDSIATDPPYGIAFMGKSWDKAIPSIDVWKECLRVLKPGAFAFVMCIPRQDCLARMIVSLEDAGFRINFSSIFHTFGSGFPKAQNISKAVEKKNKKIKAFSQGFITAGDDGRKAEFKQKLSYRSDYGYEWKPATPQAQVLDGSFSGYQPKPAVEVVIVAMKPLSEKTYVDQALKNGKGVTWLDEGRIPYNGKKDIVGHRSIGGFNSGGNANSLYDGKPRPVHNSNYNQGRFPANLLVSDDALNDGKDRQAGGKNGLCKSSQLFGNADTRIGTNIGNRSYGDSGSFSRYFSLDAWFDKKLKELPAGVQKTFPFLIVPKASKAEKNRGCEGLEYKQTHFLQDDGRKNPHPVSDPRMKRPQKHLPTKNYHPTVKPLKLFSYLITLGSREGDVILDPFIGSGTTAIAASMLGRRYIGFETEEEYVRIARARLSAVQLQLL